MTELLSSKPGRVVEWQHGVIMLAIGAVLLWPAPTMVGPLFEPLTEMMPEKGWAAFMLSMGALRCGALIINGSAPTGSPLARMAVATLATPVWMILTYAFATAAPVGLWAAAVYAVLALFEVRIMWSAARDLKG